WGRAPGTRWPPPRRKRAPPADADGKSLPSRVILSRSTQWPTVNRPPNPRKLMTSGLPAVRLSTVARSFAASDRVDRKRGRAPRRRDAVHHLSLHRLSSDLS